MLTTKQGDPLRAGARAGVVKGKAATRPGVVFMFSGQGAQYPSMARGLYAAHRVFREAFDCCADMFEPLIGRDLRAMVFADFANPQAQPGIAPDAVHAILALLRRICDGAPVDGVGRATHRATRPQHRRNTRRSAWLACCRSRTRRVPWPPAAG